MWQIRRQRHGSSAVLTPRTGTHRSALDDQDRAIAIMLDLLDPLVAFGQLIGEVRKLWCNEAIS